MESTTSLIPDSTSLNTSEFAMQATQTTQQSTLPAPQETPKEEAKDKENTEIIAEKEEQQPRPQPLHQATVEDDTETIAKSIPESRSTLSSIPRLCTIPFSGDQAACLSNAPYQHALILGLMLNTIFGHIEHSASMEASGEG